MIIWVCGGFGVFFTYSYKHVLVFETLAEKYDSLAEYECGNLNNYLSDCKLNLFNYLFLMDISVCLIEQTLVI